MAIEDLPDLSGLFGSTKEKTLERSLSSEEQVLLAEKQELSDWEQFSNIFSNASLTLQNAWNSTQVGAIDFANYLGIVDDNYADNFIEDEYAQIEAINKKYADTGKGIVGGFEEGDLADVALGIVNALTSVVTTVAPAIATRGLSLIPQIMAPMYTEYNSEKAKMLYGDEDIEESIRKLRENEEDEVAVPMALGAASVALEKIGIKGISKFILNNARTAGAKKIGALVLTGNKEGLTEYFQGGLNAANIASAKGKNAPEAVYNHLTSKNALEEYLQGFVGGTGMSAAGAKISSAFRNDKDNLIVNDYINMLGSLNQQKVNSKTEEAKSAVDKKIKKAEQDFKNFLILNQKKSEYLTEDQSKEIVNILDNKNKLESKVQDLQKQVRNGDINQDEYSLIIEDIKEQVELGNKNLNDIKVEANKKKLHEDLRTSEDAISGIKGLTQKVYKTPDEFLKAINSKSKKQYTLEDLQNVDGLIVDGEIMINETVAAETNAITVGSHELLHGIVKSSITGEVRTIKDGNGNSVDVDITVEGAKLIKEFLSTLNAKETKVVQKRIDDNYKYNKDGSEKAFEQYAEEYLNAYADAAIKNELSDSVLVKIGKFLSKIFNSGDKGYKNLEFKTGKDVKEFLKAYVSDRKKGKFRQQFVEMAQEGAKTKTVINKESRSKAVDAVNKMEQGAKTKAEFQKPGIFNNVYNSITQDGGAINNYVKSLGLSKEKFQETIDSLSDRLMNYDPASKRKTDSGEPVTIGEFLMSNIGFAKLDAAKKLAIEGKRTKRETSTDVGATTKEGDVKMQVEDTDTSAQEVLDEQDMSVEGIAKREAKEAKAKKKRYSKLRQELGFETDGDTYNTVLDAARKSLLLAYGKTLKITNAKARVDKIVELIKKEYNSLNSDLFKPLKNFLGTKEYLINLKKFREVIVESIPTADLVQMEKFVPDNEKIFTTFVRKLTAKAQVQDAVDKNLLPKDALNTIDKGEAVNLYEKVMPSPNEFIGFANQPAINPDTGAKSGLKGTRKDGFAKRIAESLILDAVMEVRQETEVQQTLTEDLNVEMDVQQLASKIGREVDVKFSKSNAVADINNAIDTGVDTGVYLQIRFSKSHREQYENRLVKKRPDLSKEQRENAVQSIFDFIDGKNIPDNKKSKYEKMAMHYTANGYLILPEDGYKIIEAEKLATKNKIDPFSVKDPNALIQTYVEDSRSKRTDPDKVKTFSNKTEYSSGVVVYDVEDSKQGQRDVREVADTHFGEKFQNWCLIHREQAVDQAGIDAGTGVSNVEEITGSRQAYDRVDELEAQGYIVQEPYAVVRGDNNTTVYEIEYASKTISTSKDALSTAFKNWENYNQEGNGFKVAFHNGKLVSFRDGNQMQWWDINDNSTDAVVVRGKKVGDGFKEVIQVSEKKETLLYTEKQTGNKKNGTYIKKDLDGNVVEITTKKDNFKYGKQFKRLEKTYYTAEITELYNVKSFNRGYDRTSLKEVRIYKDHKGESGTHSFTNGRDETRVDNITKWQRNLIDTNAGTQDSGINLTTTTIEGTINQKYFKEFNDPSSITDGFVKTNLQDLTAGHERYYNRQGEKVTVVVEQDQSLNTVRDPGNQSLSVTINGEVQERRVRFSRSANNEAKFSLSELEQNRKTLPAILKRQIEVEERMLKNPTAEDLYFLDRLSDLEFAIENNLNYEEAFAIFQLTLPDDVSSLLVDFKDIDSFENYVKNISIPAIRTLGLNAAKTYFKNKFNSLTTDKQKVDLIIKFLKNIGISARGDAKALEVSFTNQRLLEGPVTEIFGKKFVEEHFNLGEVKKGKTIRYSYDGKKGTFEKVELYTDIENIKNSRGDTEVVKQVNKDAKEANEFIDEIISSDLSISEKIAIIELISLSQRGATRKSYAFGETVTDKVTKPASELVLEHEITVKNMTKYLRQRIKGILTQEQLVDIRSQAKVHVWDTKIDNILNVEKTTDGKSLRYEGGRSRYQNDKVKNYLTSQFEKGLITNIPVEINQISNLDSLIKFSRSTNNPTKGISILDFDDTLATTKSKIRFTRPDGTEGTLTPEQYASTYQDLLGLDYKFDFSEFNKVVDGKPAPLLNKAKKLAGKFGTDNMFILTARPQESAVAIQKFLKENGLNIPLKNITGLGNSTADAKALWVLDKAAEGYNDFYFADDAIQNVKAVQNMLDQIDVKSKVQQARVKFSKSMDKDFNDILEDISGIESNKRFSEAKARRRGKRKGKFRFFVPPSHEDFIGLLYNFMGRGEKGNQQRNFFEQSLVRPLNRAYRELNAAKQAIANDYRALIKSMPDVRKKLGKKILDGDFTNEDAIRVYLWDKFGLKIPGMSKTDQKNLVEFVKSDPEMQEFADKLGRISKDKKGYVQPSDNWDAGGIKYDLIDATGRIGRAKFFQEFIENAGIIFSEKNLNKIQAIYGEDFRSALEDMLYRVTKGTNRPTGKNKLVNRWLDWINGSVGATMFFNARSAVLQQLSFVNFMNFADNNVFKAAARFADQKQFWKDFAMIFNSDYLKQRRSGAGFDVSSSEIAREVSNAKDPVSSAIRYILNKGFLPTQMGDSFAIAIGGASFLRNRINTYLKQGLTKKEAEAKAFIDFQQIAEATQQSARPDMISQQQASVLGRFILAFQNVTSQYARIVKKSGIDLVKRRKSPGYVTQAQSDMANVSRIIYYGAIQSMVFYGLQSALFAMMFDDDEKDEEFFDKKKDRILNNTLDSLLKGMGVGGAVVSTLKNTIIKFVDNSKSESYFKSPAWVELLQISPPIGIKVRKLSGAERTADWNKDVIKEMETFDIDNPLWDAVTSSTEAITNIPLNRLHRKVQNLRAASDSENAWWQRVAVTLGWNKWDVGIPDREIEEIKKGLKGKKSSQSTIPNKEAQESENKEKQKQERKQNKKVICAGVTSKGGRCKKEIESGTSYCTIHAKVAKNKSGKKTQCKKMKQVSKKKRERCGMMTNSKSGYCYYHD